jgi:hypothetical protein
MSSTDPKPIDLGPMDATVTWNQPCCGSSKATVRAIKRSLKIPQDIVDCACQYLWLPPSAFASAFGIVI